MSARSPEGASLAILGGTPRFRQPLHVGRPNIGDRDALRRRFDEMLDRNWLTNDGPFTREFEQRICAFVGVKHAIAMCNATVALEIAIRALGLRGEVIVPSFTFVATAHALQWQEITPVFADVDPATHNIAPQSIERLITPRTTGILGVHVWGRACDTKAIEDLAASRGLTVFYDAAHAFGVSLHGRMVGNFGACEVFSFHATKFLNTFEGGAVVTNDDDLAEKLRLMRNFGFAGYDRVVYLGVNGKMPEICAAMGITSLESMEQIVETNRSNHERYRDGLQGLPGVTLVAFDHAERNNWQYVVAEIDGTASPLTRDHLLAALHAENVLARKYFWPGCHRMEPYRSLQPNAALLLPETERLAGRVMVLPTGTAVTGFDIDQIVDIIRTAFALAPDIQAAIGQMPA